MNKGKGFSRYTFLTDLTDVDFYFLLLFVLII